MTKQIQDTIIYILSQILDRTTEDILNDQNTYAAYHWDDGFLDIFEDELDWASGEFVTQEEVEYLFWGRGDFDGKRSIIYDESIDPGAVEDEPLLSIAKRYNGHMYLPHFGELIRAGLIKEVDYPSFYGKIQSGPSLVEVATHLFALHQPITPLDEEFYEVDEEWVGMLEKIEDKALREHLGIFFQDINIARCFGAYFEGGDDGSWESFIDIQPIACWSTGEGQGEFCIARVLNTTIEPLDLNIEN